MRSACGIALGLALAGALTLAACGGGDSRSGGQAPEDEGDLGPSTTVTVENAAIEDALAVDGQLVVGDAKPDLADPNGQLAVVDVGDQLSGASLPVILQNGTDAAVWRPTVSGTARDPSGALVGSGEDQTFAPNYLKPGQITLGYVYFGGVALPPTTKFELQVSSEGGEFENIRDLLIPEVNRSGPDILGTIKNPHDVPITLPNVYVACFQGTKLVRLTHNFATPDPLPPGGQGSFSVSVRSGPCSTFLAAASGYAP
jgi:hypothetical protein